MAGCEDGPNKVCQAGNLLQGLCLQGSFQIFHFKLFKCPADCINNNIIKEGMNICISRTCRLRQSRTSLRRPQTSLSELSACAVGLSSSGAIPPSSSDQNHHHQITITVIISIVIIVITSMMTVITIVIMNQLLHGKQPLRDNCRRLPDDQERLQRHAGPPIHEEQQVGEDYKDDDDCQLSTLC